MQVLEVSKLRSLADPKRAPGLRWLVNHDSMVANRLLQLEFDLSQSTVPENMKLAWNISLALTIAGVAAIAVAMVMGSQPLLELIGLLLIVAGVVKIAMVKIWIAFFKLETTTAPDHSSER